MIYNCFWIDDQDLCLCKDYLFWYKKMVKNRFFEIIEVCILKG